MKINGEKLKAVRKALDIEVKEVAIAADLTPQRINQLERGVNLRLNNNIVHAIAKLLKVKPVDLQ